MSKISLVWENGIKIGMQMSAWFQMFVSIITKGNEKILNWREFNEDACADLLTLAKTS